jgi:hypothetical protein
MWRYLSSRTLLPANLAVRARLLFSPRNRCLCSLHDRPLQQNALFGAALRSLGFQVVESAARVVRSGAEGAEPAEPPSPAEQHDGILYPAEDVVVGPLDHQYLLVVLDGRLWLADVGFGAQTLPLPFLLPRGVEHYVQSSEDSQEAMDAYSGLEWAQGLPVQRLARYRLRLGLPGSKAPVDSATTPLFGSRAGYYLQGRSQKGQDWKDLFFFRHVESRTHEQSSLFLCMLLQMRDQLWWDSGCWP